MDILHAILDNKVAEVAEARKLVPMTEIRAKAALVSDHRDFKRALDSVPIAVIAEIKKASPSKGVMVEQFDHRALAGQYQSGGAHALSVLTDEKYFQGHKSFVRDVKQVTTLPVLRKDFILDEYQVYESVVLGADAILLIVRALSREQLRDLYACARDAGLDVLVETHSADEIGQANAIGAEIIGINNRDLSTFVADVRLSALLRGFIGPQAIAVSESGIGNADDVRMLKDAGFQAVLVGEGLIRHADRAAATRSFIPG
jgi:indole-3-glycerol phosphate synthase